MGESLHKRAGRYSRNSFPANMEQPLFQKHNNTLFYQELYNRGVSYIRDIVEGKGKFLTWCLAKEKYGLQNQHFLSGLSVIETVPQKWKQQIGSVEHIIPSNPLRNKVIPIIKGSL